jgi:hypothetical protein
MLYILNFSIQGRLGSFWVVLILSDLWSKIKARMNQHLILLVIFNLGNIKFGF